MDTQIIINQYLENPLSRTVLNALLSTVLNGSHPPFSPHIFGRVGPTLPIPTLLIWDGPPEIPGWLRTGSCGWGTIGKTRDRLGSPYVSGISF